MKKLYYKFTKKYWSMLSYEHARKHNFVVQYGIFKNLKIIILSRNSVQLGCFTYLVINFIPILPSGSFFNDL